MQHIIVAIPIIVAVVCLLCTVGVRAGRGEVKRRQCVCLWFDDCPERQAGRGPNQVCPSIFLVSLSFVWGWDWCYGTRSVVGYECEFGVYASEYRRPLVFG